MIVYANALAKANAGCGIVQSDDVGEIQNNDPKIIPCIPVQRVLFVRDGE